MPTAVKFCGLTRPVDAAFAAELGAAYVGAIFAESPRRVNAAGAAELYAAARRAGSDPPQPVAVFGDTSPSEIAGSALAAGARVVQLHGGADASTLRAVRTLFEGELWAVLRVTTSLPTTVEDVFELADGVVLDTARAAALGGTGQSFDWNALADALKKIGRPKKLVLAGGLRPSNVGGAIRMLLPDVVDVSSGVESSPGVKDHALMSAFVEAVARSGPR